MVKSINGDAMTTLVSASFSVINDLVPYMDTYKFSKKIDKKIIDKVAGNFQKNCYFF